MALRAVARFPCLSAPTVNWHSATLICSEGDRVGGGRSGAAVLPGKAAWRNNHL